MSWDITKRSLVDHEAPRILLGTGRLAAKGGEVVLLGCFRKMSAFGQAQVCGG
jgi:hypothetical protein